MYLFCFDEITKFPFHNDTFIDDTIVMYPFIIVLVLCILFHSYVEAILCCKSHDAKILFK